MHTERAAARARALGRVTLAGLRQARRPGVLGGLALGPVLVAAVTIAGVLGLHPMGGPPGPASGIFAPSADPLQAGQSRLPGRSPAQPRPATSRISAEARPGTPVTPSATPASPVATTGPLDRAPAPARLCPLLPTLVAPSPVGTDTDGRPCSAPVLREDGLHADPAHRFGPGQPDRW